MYMMIPPLILAENFDGLYQLLLLIPITLIVAALASFVPAVLGDWSTTLLAGPVIGFSLLLFLTLAPAHAPIGIMLLVLTPAGLGMASMMVWSARRRRDET